MERARSKPVLAGQHRPSDRLYRAGAGARPRLLLRRRRVRLHGRLPALRSRRAGWPAPRAQHPVPDLAGGAFGSRNHEQRGEGRRSGKHEGPDIQSRGHLQRQAEDEDWTKRQQVHPDPEERQMDQQGRLGFFASHGPEHEGRGRIDDVEPQGGAQGMEREKDTNHPSVWRTARLQRRVEQCQSAHGRAPASEGLRCRLGSPDLREEQGHEDAFEARDAIPSSHQQGRGETGEHRESPLDGSEGPLPEAWLPCEHTPRGARSSEPEERNRCTEEPQKRVQLAYLPT
mmetsp:Transcript_92656/g.262112  ORF Transcript_92656/g.262112 Transcript_92656/m.262112 type:complete len:286 (+) Transcript_92656:3629-4486(+)